MTIQKVLSLPIGSVKPNPNQPRRYFDDNALNELAASIKAYGILQPISVRVVNGCQYELVAGERRLRASHIAGMSTIPAIVVSISTEDSAVLAIIENLQRENLQFFEEAEGFLNLMNDYAFTQEALAVRVGKNQSTIANKLRLLKLPPAIRELITTSALTERHARALLKLSNEDEQLSVLEKIIKEGLTVRKTEDLIDLMLTKRVEKKGNTIPFKAYIRDIRILTNTIQENLEIVRRSGLETDFNMEQTDNGYNIFITVSFKQAAAKALALHSAKTAAKAI